MKEQSLLSQSHNNVKSPRRLPTPNKEIKGVCRSVLYWELIITYQKQDYKYYNFIIL
jgi:hypothetical protein